MIQKMKRGFYGGSAWVFENPARPFLLGLIGLVVALALIYGATVKRKAMIAYEATQMSRIAPPATKPDSIAQVIQDTTPDPQPAPIKRIYTEKVIFCYGKGKSCWDPETNRLINLGKLR